MYPQKKCIQAFHVFLESYKIPAFMMFKSLDWEWGSREVTSFLGNTVEILGLIKSP